MASSSSSIRDLRPLLVEQGQPPAQVPQRESKGDEEEEPRDWAALPVDALLAVLSRLGGVDILMGAGHLELSRYDRGSVDDCLDGVSESCPLLRHLRLNHDCFYYFRPGFFGGCECKSTEVVGMHGLRSLQLFANSISNQELTAILDGCQQLESLDIRHCFNVFMDDEMRARCARVKTLRLPEDSMEDYNLPYASPVRDCVYYSGVMY
ncbi:unnamed protein product [Urochloa decumbens]|uniref:Uncharacterized protein n=1 Tax=Urochloa decumbens TaxID=240449 RepID=A0ABC9BUG6_9POAL